MELQSPAANNTACIEHGVWTPIPRDAPYALDTYTLRLKDVAAAEHDRIVKTGVMTFHMTGCAGDFSNHQPQTAVATAMAAQVRDRGAIGMAGSIAEEAAFLYLLGDVVYKDDDDLDPEGRDQAELYAAQFYQPYANYSRRIFAIAGNHDGKHSKDPATCAIDHFLTNFCATHSSRSPDNHIDDRPAMTQPYVYWRLTTPLAYIVGLYSNIANGGMLDDPHHPNRRPQYDWLVQQLQDIRKRNEDNKPRKAVILAVHYPPYSGAANFAQRGDPTEGLMKAHAADGSEAPAPPVKAANAHPLAGEFEAAYQESGQFPDAVFSAHAHLYQRLTNRYADGREAPYLICGSGGHSPVENIWERCDKTIDRTKVCPFDAVLPPGITLLPGQRVQVAAYNDHSFGYLRLTIKGRRLYGEFFGVTAESLALADSFSLNLDTHRLETGG